MSMESNQFLEMVKRAFFKSYSEGDVVLDNCMNCGDRYGGGLSTFTVLNVGNKYLTCKCHNCGHFKNIKKGSV